MELFERLQPDFYYEDDRGWLAQLVHQGYEQVNVLFTKAGVERGGHYHKVSREAFFVVRGQVEIILKKDEKWQMIRFSQGGFFEIEPRVIHRMRFPENCVLVAMYDVPIERPDGTKDIYASEV